MTIFGVVFCDWLPNFAIFLHPHDDFRIIFWDWLTKFYFFFQAIGEIRDVYQWPISKICNFFSPTGWPNLRPFFPITDWQISWYFPWLSEEIYDIYWHNNKICNFFNDWLKKYTIFCRDWLTKLAIFINNSIDEFRNLLRDWWRN